MESPVETISANDFLTPPRILIPKLARSRDQWKAKAHTRNQQYRKEKIHSRDLEISRRRWKERAVLAEQKLQELQHQHQQTEADLAQARAHIAQIEDASPKN
jgi:hypothetical protein